MKINGILETVVYARDLEAAETFYKDVLGLEPFAVKENRHVFFRCGNQVFLVFNPVETQKPPDANSLPVPPHGATGAGHVCFRASAQEIVLWRARLEELGVEIEADFEWPNGGRSLYFRDPCDNCVEIAEPRIWGLEEDSG